MSNDQSCLSKEILLEVVMCLNYSWKQHPCYHRLGQCDICFDDTMVNEYVLETACGHTYHRACLIATLKDFKFKICPTCRVPYSKKVDID
jgi:hypothetical protein